MIPPLAQRLVSRLGTQPQCLSQSILNRFLLNFGIYILTKCMEIIQAIMQIIMQTILQANVQPFMQAIIQISKKRAVHILACEIFVPPVRSTVGTRNLKCLRVCLQSHFTDKDCNCLYLTQYLTDFGQILDSKSYDQA